MNDTLDPIEKAVSPSLRSAEVPRGKKTSMAAVNLFLDIALFLAIIAVMWVTVILRVIFPAASAATGWRLWGLTFDEWDSVQFYALCVFAALCVEHLALHWNWVCSAITTHVFHSKNRPDEGVQAVYGVGTFITILISVMASLVAAVFMVERPG